MPELPEVETIVHTLRTTIINTHITKAVAYTKALREPIQSAAVHELAGYKIDSIARRAKYIIIIVSTETTQNSCNAPRILIHLGMSGKLLISDSAYIPLKHDHVALSLSNGMVLALNDSRRFGLFLVCSAKDIDARMLRLGQEPFAESFDNALYFKLITSGKRDIKSALTAGNILAGVGNIYASEILFAAGIDPRRKLDTLHKCDAARILGCTRQILSIAIEKGGSTIKDYINAEGLTGNYQEDALVYDRAKEPCRNCNRPIAKIKQGGRATYMCESCQT